MKIITKDSFRCNPLTSLSLGSGITAIEEDAFSGSRNGDGCSGKAVLADLVIPNSVKTIGTRAFANTGVKSLTLGISIESITSYAFEKNAMSNLVVPKSVKAIGNGAFQFNSLVEVSFLGDAPNAGTNVFAGNPILSAVGRPGASTGWGTTWGGANVAVAQVPKNSAAPSISSTIGVSGALISDRGSWIGFPVPAYFYQWWRCDTNGELLAGTPGDCVEISGAVGMQYLPTIADFNAYLRFSVRATNSLGSATTYSATSAKITGVPPKYTLAPAVSGAMKIGTALNGSPGTWSGASEPTYAYVWVRCSAIGGVATTLPSNCAVIGDAAAATYTPTNADYSTYLRIGVTATSGAGSTTVYSATSAKVIGTPPTNTLPPSISGTAAVGKSLTADKGIWAGYPAPTTTFQWYVCTKAVTAARPSAPSTCKKVTAATKSAFKLTPALRGKYVAVLVTGRSTGMASTSWLSQTTEKVK